MAHNGHLSSQQVMELFSRYVIGNYRRFPVCLVRGQGSYVWDAEGNRYLDLFPGWGCNLLGHCPPRVVQAVREQVGELIHVPNTWYMEAQGLLAKALSERSFGGQCFFCNSGAEAVEAAIKLARLHGRPNRYKIIAMLNSFHGRTFGALSATGQPKYHHGFEPLLPGFRHVPFGDADAVAEAIDDETCAILVEPVQGEGGIRISPPDYLPALRQLADQHNLLLIFDEVQTGLGRTGRWFAYQHWGVEPDVMTLAKGLAGGLAAGAVIARKEVAERLQPGMHAATFGGNPIACRAALAAIETIENGDLLARAGAIAERFREHLLDLQQRCPLIREVRILGAMIGIELHGDGTPIVQACLEKRLLVNCTQQTVIRLLPALTITDDEIDRGCEILADVLMSAAHQPAVATTSSPR
jgi:acetylornithine/N-succinyldiaminopimelate aminotransferase